MEHGIAELQKAYPQCVLPYWNPIESYSEFLGKAGRFVEAEKYARQALACLTPEVMGTAYESQTLFALGRALRGQGRIAEARTTLQRSYNLYEKLRGKDHQTTVTVRLELEKLDRPNPRP
jgi:tetratricopeptide (TPR) repeat protein